MRERSSVAAPVRPPAPPQPAVPAPGRPRSRLVTPAAVALALVAVVLTVADVPGTLRAVVVAAALLTAPGLALLTRVECFDPWARAAATVALSLAVQTAVALAMVWSRTWYPAVAGCLLLLLSAVVLAVQEVRSSPDPTPPAPGPGAGRAQATGGLWPDLVLGAGLAVAALLWLMGVAGTSAVDLGGWGLLTALPAPWFAALALALAGTVWGAVGRRRLREGLVAAHLALVVLILYGTATLVEETPRLPWVYKHIAVTRYLELHGAVDPSIDIYQRWPGFFALTAQLARMIGLADPVSWAALAEPGFALLDALLVLAIARTLSRDRRWCWSAALLFSVTNWVAQNYFAPQALGYTLHLFLALVLMTARSAPPHRRGEAIERLAARVLRLGTDRGDASPGQPMTAAAATAPPPRWWTTPVVLGVFAVVVASHQLTPYLVLLAVGPLFLLGYLRPFPLVLVMAAMPVAYLVPNLDYVESHFGLFSGFDPFANALYSAVDRSALLPGAVWHARGSQLLSALVYLLACVGLLRHARAGGLRPALVVGWLMASPVLVLAAQSYGGEGRLRIYLFSLPWAAMAAAWAFRPGGTAARTDLSGQRSRLRGALPFAATVTALTALFTLCYFQPEEDYRIPRTEVLAAQWVDGEVRRGDVVLATSPNFPLLVGPHYENLTLNDPLPDYEDMLPRPLTADGVLALADGLAPVGGSDRVYLVFSEQQYRFDARHRVYEPGELADLEEQVNLRSGDRPVYDSGSVRIYRLR